MGKRKINSFLAVAFISSFLAGCDKSPEKVDALAPAIIHKEAQRLGVDNPDAPTTKELMEYYNSNIKEAHKVWKECIEKGLDKIPAERKSVCVAAGNAWQSQPYKPR